MAQSKDPNLLERAQVLFDQGSAELDQGNYASACEKLQQVTRLVPEKIGAKETLAECYEKAGKLASAWSMYNAALQKAREQKQAQRAAALAQQVARIQPRLAALLLEVPASERSLPGLAIMRDGGVVTAIDWGKPVPVDTGNHEIEATSPGCTPFRTTVKVPRDGAKVTVVIGPLQCKTVTATSAAPTSATQATPPRLWQGPLGVGVLGVSVLGVGIGAVLGGLAIAKNGESNADGHCNEAKDQCDVVGYPLRKEAWILGTGSTTALVIGSTLFAAGLVIVITAPRSPEDSRRKKITTHSDDIYRGPAVIEFAGNTILLKGAW